ncbi:MAG: carboxypeptidase regulatory-like domain-containing protein, partial [Thermoplasmata archaeon]|nr:carboxypeptidase regulatory-like domain-containing protein [Thermoplasmata archaeon]
MSAIAAPPLSQLGSADIGGYSEILEPSVNETETTPSNASTGVSPTQNVIVVFNESMNTTVIPTLTQTGGIDPGGWTFEGWSNTTVVNDTATWSHNDWYVFDTITMEVSGYENESGILGAPYTWSFSTIQQNLYIRGKVVDNLNTPLSNIIVKLNNTPEIFEFTTLSAGTYEFALDGDLDDGRGYYTVSFTSGMWKDKQVNLEPTSFNQTGIANIGDLVMVKKEKIQGMVKELGSKSDIPNVNITITDEFDSDVWYALTDSNGWFFVYVDATNVKLEFKKNGYYGNSTLETLTLSQEKIIDTIYMEKITPTPEVKVFGWVDSTAEPKLGGVWVEISEDGVRWIGNYTEDTAGYFEIMSYSGRLMIRAAEDNHETFEDWIDVPTEGSVNFDITMTPLPIKYCSVNGTVKDSGSGLPIENAIVALYDNSGSYVDQTLTSDTGAYGIPFYESATFTLVVSKANYFTNASEQIDLLNNFTGANPVNVTLDPIDQDKVLEGVVKNSETNGALIGATVTIYNSAKLYENQTTTSIAGYFKLNTFDATFMMLVDAVGYQSILISITDVDTYQQVQ